MIRKVVVEVLDSNQRSRLLAEAGAAASIQEAPQGPLVLQGEAELAYLTHEGLFISDAYEAQQDRSAAPESRTQQDRSAAPESRTLQGDEPSPEVSETSSREQGFMYVFLHFYTLLLTFTHFQRLITPERTSASSSDRVSAGF